jgi:hypothetical protein
MTFCPYKKNDDIACSVIPLNLINFEDSIRFQKKYVTIFG